MFLESREGDRRPGRCRARTLACSIGRATGPPSPVVERGELEQDQDIQKDTEKPIPIGRWQVSSWRTASRSCTRPAARSAVWPAPAIRCASRQCATPERLEASAGAEVPGGAPLAFLLAMERPSARHGPSAPSRSLGRDSPRAIGVRWCPCEDSATVAWVSPAPPPRDRRTVVAQSNNAPVFPRRFGGLRRAPRQWLEPACVPRPGSPRSRGSASSFRQHMPISPQRHASRSPELCAIRAHDVRTRGELGVGDRRRGKAGQRPGGASRRRSLSRPVRSGA